jgi:hypothetical protein
MLKIEPKGEVEVKRNGKPHVLLRYEIVLRGGSRYPVWGTPDGLLVRLVPAVAKEPRRAGIVLRGWEDVVELLHNG